MVAYSQRDYRAALGEFRALASQGDRIAQYRIGKMYYYGQGVPQDYVEALTWYKKAAERDNADALFSVARMYNSGIGVQRDYIEAMKWYRKAAELGHGDSQTHLGLMYYVGMEVSRDHIEALKWLNIASSLGVDVAPRYSDIVAQRMTELQRDERNPTGRFQTTRKPRNQQRQKPADHGRCAWSRSTRISPSMTPPLISSSSFSLA